MDQAGIEVQRRDYARRPLTLDELHDIVGDRSPADLINPRSRAFRQLDVRLEALTDAQALDLMVQDNAIIRRPILVRAAERIVGFDPDVYAALTPG